MAEERATTHFVRSVTLPTLGIVTQTVTARLKYAAQVLVERIMGLRLRLVPLSDWEATSEMDVNVLWVGYDLVDERFVVSISADGLLAEQGVDAARESPLISDPFAQTFWYLAEYANYQTSIRDTHGRYPEPLPELPGALPELHLAARQLAKQLGINLVPKQHVVHFTLDLDFPWQYAHKGCAVQAGAVAKRLVKGKLGEGGDALRVLFGGRDPNAIYDELPRYLPPERTRLFLLAGGTSGFDSRFSFRNKSYIKLLDQLRGMGYSFGIHPSYLAAEDDSSFRYELTAMAAWGGAVVHSRFHYGRYQLPFSRRMLLAAGIRNDYTTFWVTQNGFRHQIAVPFPWYDLEREEITELILHPTVWMDRVMLASRKHTPVEAITEGQAWMQAVQEVGGEVCVLVHNELFTNYGEWKGWLPFANWVSTL